MNAVTETEVIQACQTLFGDDVNISLDFLYYSIQPSGVKSAYRKKAKEIHPDLFAADPVHVQQKQNTLLREIIQAYDVLNLFFKQREGGAWRPGKAPGASTGVRRARQRRPEPPSASSSPRHKGDDIYYRGEVPLRRLQIGQYLFYRGKITFGSLIQALVWQRKQRPTIGNIALQWGLLDREAVDSIFGLCGRPRPFGEKAVELGLLSAFQVNTLLLYQRSLQDPLGRYFTGKNLLSLSDVERLAADLKKHNARIVAASCRGNLHGCA
jgi:hypothetical protein